MRKNAFPPKKVRTESEKEKKAMLLMERVKIITEYLSEHEYATVKQIAADVPMSETTVRRDLKYLEERNAVKRNYGGAALVSHLHKTVPFDFRAREHAREKELIAEKAALLIHAGDTVFLDESSTTCALAEILDEKQDVTVITPSMAAAAVLGGKNIRTYCAGGLYDPVTSSFRGRMTEEFFSAFNANVAFFSATCVSENGRITDSRESGAYLKRALLKNAEKKVFLCDGSKFGKTSLATVCTLAEIDAVVSDVPLPEALKDTVALSL